jgi:copper homeostasis protein
VIIEMDLEVCIDSVESAIAAEAGGAERVELCSDLLEGGITPSAGLIATVRRRVGIDVFVMIRPRGGDFIYSDLELELMHEEITHAKHLGASGFVLGALNEAGRVDVAKTRTLVEQAAPLPVTFHRAMDMTPNLIESLEDVIATGATRVLTSGGAANVVSGTAQIAALVEASGGRISIMPGGGVKPENIGELARLTGAQEFHASVRTAFQSPTTYRREGVSMGDAQDAEFRRYEVKPENVRKLIACMSQAFTPVATVQAIAPLGQGDAFPECSVQRAKPAHR